jgi:hypothetical protein
LISYCHSLKEISSLGGQSAKSVFNPIKGSGYGLLPQLIMFRPSRVIRGGIPGFIDTPVSPHFVGILPETNSQAGGVSCA